MKIIKTFLCLLIFIGGVGCLLWRFLPKGYSFSFRDTPVTEALAKVRDKTGEPILYLTNLTAKVTMETKHAPLDYVLDLMSEKAHFGWHEVFVIYKNSAAWDEFRGAVVNEIEPTSFQHRDIISLGWLFRGKLDLQQAWQPVLVDFSVKQKSLGEAATQLSKLSRARVLVESSLAGTTVSVDIKQRKMAEAAEALTHAAGARLGRAIIVRAPWALTKGFNPQAEFQSSNLGQAAQENAMTEFQGMMASMSAEERAKIQPLVMKYLPVIMSMRSLTPEERKAKFAEIAQDPEVQKVFLSHLQNRLENSSPEERAQRRQQFMKWRKEHRYGERPHP